MNLESTVRFINENWWSDYSATITADGGIEVCICNIPIMGCNAKGFIWVDGAGHEERDSFEHAINYPPTEPKEIMADYYSETDDAGAAYDDALEAFWEFNREN